MAYTTIDDPSAHFQVATYTGTGSELSVTNSGNSDLQPDFVWVKDRGAANDHKLTDSSRLSSGNPTITLEANTYAAEYDDADPAATTSFNTDGFTIGTNGNYNTDDNEYVAWQWKANGGTRTTNTESGNDPGGGYQANTTAGFSIVDYTGTGGAGTMAHGLGAVPKVIMVKNRSSATDWAVYHASNTAAPETDYLVLNDHAATADSSDFWNDTAPTSTVFSLGTHDRVNDDSETLIAYLWTEIQGYSKFGSYTGNGAADGAFIYLGFKPAYFLCKQITSRAWTVYDNKRPGYNSNDGKILVPSESGAEENGDIDFVANGIKLRQNHTAFNESDGTYVYMAFAEQPFVTSGGVPCTAF